MSNGIELIKCLGDKISFLRGKLTINPDMRKLNWFRTGGISDVLFEPLDEEDLICFLRAVPIEIPITMIGLGSNILVREAGIRGFIVRLPLKFFGSVRMISDSYFTVGAACSSRQLSLFAMQKEMMGFHFYYGIPGSIGGALRMNAGANGVETSDHLVQVRAVDRAGVVHTLMHKDMGFSYRHCSVSEDMIFLSALFSFQKGEKAEIELLMKQSKEHRQSVQPIYEKTGGSTFKNPLNSSAWKVIDAAGCRGLKINEAMISTMHCNFIINTGNATGHDLELLAETVRSRVLDHSGVHLKWEIRRFGEFYPNRKLSSFLK